MDLLKKDEQSIFRFGKKFEQLHARNHHWLMQPPKRRRRQTVANVSHFLCISITKKIKIKKKSPRALQRNINTPEN